MMDPQSGDTFQPGDLLNNTYRIEAMLGRGGTSEVYRARSEIAGRVVAVKVLKSEFSGNEDYLSLMIREEEIRDIRHDAVVRYSENHRLPDGQVYLVMDFVDGPGLDAKLQGGGMSAEDGHAKAEEQREEIATASERGLKLAFLYNRIAKQQDIVPTLDEAVEQVRSVAAAQNADPDQSVAAALKEGWIADVQEQLAHEKAREWLRERAVITETEPTPADESADTEAS